MINFRKVKRFCNEDISLIENYDKAISDSNQTWHCHHRRELETSRKQLIENNEYYNRPASELIFLTKSEHMSLHHKGKQLTEETKHKMSESNKGKNKGKTPWNKGKTTWMKGKHLSEEHKLKIGEYSKMSHWFNNGIAEVFVKECPEGFVKGRLKRKTQITV